jgi:hypothetical protein
MQLGSRGEGFEWFASIVIVINAARKLSFITTAFLSIMIVQSIERECILR